MLWGCTLHPGHPITETFDDEVHLSMAALESEDGFETFDTPVYNKVKISTNTSEYVLCTLIHGIQFQQHLDIKLSPGETIGFSVQGKYVVHLLGYSIPSDITHDDNFIETEADFEGDAENIKREEDSDVYFNPVTEFADDISHNYEAMQCSTDPSSASASETFQPLAVLSGESECYQQSCRQKQSSEMIPTVEALPSHQRSFRHSPFRSSRKMRGTNLKFTFKGKGQLPERKEGVESRADMEADSPLTDTMVPQMATCSSTSTNDPAYPSIPSSSNLDITSSSRCVNQPCNAVQVSIVAEMDHNSDIINLQTLTCEEGEQNVKKFIVPDSVYPNLPGLSNGEESLQRTGMQDCVAENVSGKNTSLAEEEVTGHAGADVENIKREEDSDVYFSAVTELADDVSHNYGTQFSQSQSAELLLHSGKVFSKQCTTCKRYFKTLSDLIKHKGQCTKRPDGSHVRLDRKQDNVSCNNIIIKDKNFVCQYCFKTFTDSSNCRRHERIHTGVKPYKCKFCKKAFNQSNGLKSHVRGVHCHEIT